MRLLLLLLALAAPASAEPHHGKLGANLTALTPELARVAGLPPGRTGAIVANVLPGTPAQAAGLRAGDVIVGIDARTVEGPHHAADLISFHEVGDTVVLSIYRNGKALTMSTQLSDVVNEELQRPVVEGEQVQAAIAILEARIAQLEKRVAKLEHK